MSGPSRELLRQLYRTPPDRFVAARDEAVAEARRAGDVPAAREIARLRRPTVAAWLVNLLALERPELVADLGQLAESLRSAQRELRGGQLRELSTQRRAVVGALLAEVRSLATAVPGAPPPGKLPLGAVESTLNAALSDAEVAEQVRSGRLLRAASYAGFGEVPRPQLRLVTEEPAPPSRAPGGDRSAPRDRQAERAARAERERRRRALATELAKARTDQERAEAELAGAAEAERGGADGLAAIETDIAELERQRAAAEAELSRARSARRAAERAVTVARRRTGEVEAAAEAFAEEEADPRGAGRHPNV
ncbi:hypothetical protein [Salinispora sp. H7-4]|uniref:hypothetical protein n=1 Tax=Salinispora sp. H7-4 TaxID=2748321 RepID=UPI0015D2B997|nr:hypothetical protein [Salinispora sp. H7-4]NYT96605.1 hypothetical protein [Salinispora sp. H7-4]